MIFSSLCASRRRRGELEKVARLLMDIAVQTDVVKSMEEQLQLIRMQSQITGMMNAMTKGG